MNKIPRLSCNCSSFIISSADWEDVSADGLNMCMCVTVWLCLHVSVSLSNNEWVYLVVVWPPVFSVCVCFSGIETNLRDSRGRTALEILREHPAPKSQQITALIQGKMYTQTHTWDLDQLHLKKRVAGATNRKLMKFGRAWRLKLQYSWIYRFRYFNFTLTF